MKTLAAIGIFAATAIATPLCAQQKQNTARKAAAKTAINAKTTATSASAMPKTAQAKSATKNKTAAKPATKEQPTARLVRSFLEWYRQNLSQKSSAVMAAKLRSSGMVSANFGSKIGSGTDGKDRVLQIEDAPALLQNMAEIEIIPVTDLDGKALVKIIFPDAQDADVHLVKSGQKWLIDEIKSGK